MKKKMIVATLLAGLLIPSSVFAGNLLGLSIGPIAQYQNTADDAYAEATSGDTSNMLSTDNYKFGVDARVKIALFEVTGQSLVAQIDGGDATDFVFNTILTAGMSYDVLPMLRLGAGIGPSFQMGYYDDDFYYDMNMNTTGGSFSDTLSNSLLTYRITGDILLGNMMAGLSYSVPTTTTFDDFDISDASPEWGNGMFGVSVLFSLI